MTNKGRRFSTALVVLAMLSIGLALAVNDSHAEPSQRTFFASADATVMAAAPSMNFGRSNRLRIDGSPDVRSYLSFDVPTDVRPIQTATLRLWVATPAIAGITVHFVRGPWAEDTITYDNAPGPGSVLGFSGPVTKGRWVDFDVTSSVASGVVSFGIRTTGVTAAAIGSRESGPLAPQLVVETTTTTPTTAPTTTPDTAATQRLAFYYPWFPQAWSQAGFDPYSNYEPSLGYYDITPDVVARHIAEMQYGHISGGISSWWGQGEPTDLKFPMLLSASRSTGFQWSTYYEPEGSSDPSPDQIRSDLTYMRDRYATDPSYLHIDGRFVVFVYADPSDGCAMAQRWHDANDVGAYVVLKVFPGYRKCSEQPDSWHQYGPASATSAQGPYSFSVSPGFWRKGDSPRLDRQLNQWKQSVAAMNAASTQFQLITTFNEWGEGTAVESATQWASPSGHGAFLDVLHDRPPPGSTPPSSTTSAPTTTEGSTTSSSGSTSSTTSGPAPSTTQAPGDDDVRVAAVGDAACDPSDGNFNGGAGRGKNCQQRAVGDLVANGGYDAFFVLGDVQYENGSLDRFKQSYDDAFGSLLDITFPVPGNHEYITPGAAGYYDYFGPRAGDPAKGYYSFDLGAWHVLAVNSNCSQVGGCGRGSPQETWVRDDLASHPTACTAVMWHHPRWTQGEHSDSTQMSAIYTDLYNAGVELLLTGHDHNYQRFAPLDPNRTVDKQRGIREFVVGTGGKNHYASITAGGPLEVSDATTYGVLALQLHPDSYSWEFVRAADGTFTDSGSASCTP